MALFIHIQNHDFYDIANLDQLAGMTQTTVADLRDVDQTVLVDADIHKDTEINDVADSAGQHHAGLQILHFQNIFAQDGSGKFVTGIPARLRQFLCDVCQSGFSDTAILSSLGDTVSIQSGR